MLLKGPFRVLLLPSAVLLASCGGSSPSGSSSPIEEQAFGDVAVSGRLSGAPLASVSSSGAATAFVGTIQSVSIRDLTPTNDESQVALGSDDGIYLVDGSGSYPRTLVASLPAPVRSLEFSSNGKVLYYVLEDQKAYKVAATGGVASVVRSQMTLALSLSPDSTRYAFAGEANSERGVYISKLDGTGLVQLLPLASNQTVGRIGWMGNNRVVYDLAPDGVLFEQTIGSGPEPMTLPAPMLWPSVSSDAQWMYASGKTLSHAYAFRGQPTGHWQSPPYQIPMTGAVSASTVGATAEDGVFSFSINGQPGLQVVNSVTGKTVGTLANAIPALRAHVWQPRVDVPLVGAGSTGPASVGAVLFGSLGSKLGHVALADFATRSTAQLTVEDSAGSPYSVFRLEGDRFTYFANTVDRGYRPLSLIGTNTTYNGALVTFEAGKPSSVVFYKRSATSSRPQVKVVGGEIEFEGVLGQVLDGVGKVVAESAKRVRLGSGGRRTQ